VGALPEPMLREVVTEFMSVVEDTREEVTE